MTQNPLFPPSGGTVAATPAFALTAAAPATVAQEYLDKNSDWRLSNCWRLYNISCKGTDMLASAVTL